MGVYCCDCYLCGDTLLFCGFGECACCLGGLVLWVFGFGLIFVCVCVLCWGSDLLLGFCLLVLCIIRSGVGLFCGWFCCVLLYDVIIVVI